MRAARVLVGSAGVTACVLGAAIGLTVSCTSPPKLEGDALIRRGQYIVATSGCDDCHSPKVFTEMGPHPDPKRRLSGHPAGSILPPVPYDALGPDKWGALMTPDMTAWAGPWGISFAINLTPHPDGLGLWTEDQFVNSLKTGLHLGVGRRVLPPMPWPLYSQMSDEDLRAIFAFLKTLPPIANIVPQPIPPPPAQTETGEH
ncbi:MAG: hypothetical protein WCF10_03535 [Polyangiales bacterium]